MYIGCSTSTTRRRISEGPSPFSLPFSRLVVATTPKAAFLETFLARIDHIFPQLVMLAYILRQRVAITDISSFTIGILICSMSFINYDEACFRVVSCNDRMLATKHMNLVRPTCSTFVAVILFVGYHRLVRLVYQSTNHVRIPSVKRIFGRLHRIKKMVRWRH
jgi:hypothetical protein